MTRGPTSPTLTDLERIARREFDHFVAKAKPEDRVMLLLIALVELSSSDGLYSRFETVAPAAGLRGSADRQTAFGSLKRLRKTSVVHYDYDTYSCVPYVQQLALRHAVREGISIRALVETLSQAHAHYASQGHMQLQLAIAEDDPTRAEEALTGYSIHDLAAISALCVPFDPEWFAERRQVFAVLAMRALPLAQRHCETVGGLYEWLVTHVEEPDVWADRETLRIYLADLALLRGDTSTLDAQIQALEGHPHALALRGAKAFTAGDFDASLASFELASKHSAAKTPVFAGVSVVLHVLALLQRHRDGDLDLARRIGHALGRSSNHAFTGAGATLRHMAGTLADPRLAQNNKARTRASNVRHGLDPLLRSLYEIWFPPDDLDESYGLLDHLVHRAAFLERTEYDWLAREHRAVCTELRKLLPDAQEVLSSPLPEEPKSVSSAVLVNLVRRKPAWELALDEIEAGIGDAERTPAAAARTERLCWRVSPPHGKVEAILQKHTKSGWTRGKVIPPKQLTPDGKLFDSLTEADTRIAAHVIKDMMHGWSRLKYPEYRYGPGALTALVGHPLVFVTQALDEPIEVVRGEVRLKVSTQRGMLTLSIDPKETLHGPWLVVEDNRLVVYHLDPQQVELARSIGQGLSIPDEGEQRALDLVNRLSSCFAVQSSNQLAARSVEADPAPTVRLTPRGAGLDVVVGVRPLGEGGPFTSIGRGATTVMGSIQGAPAVAERNLDVERERLARLQDQCPSLTLEGADNDSWTLLDLPSALTLVSELQTVADACRVEWPAGRSFTLRRRIDGQMLRGKVQHEAGWYFASGTVALDDGVLDLAQLLELYAMQPGRFVKLKQGDYLELTDRLRKLLESLSQSGEIRRKKKQAAVAVPPSALETLEHLAEDGEGLSLDTNTREWRDRVVATFATQPDVPSTLTGELRDYQIEGYRWLARLADLGLGACLADDMGLGKTIQILALLLRRAKEGPALIVAPTSVCDNWHREAQRFAPSLRTIDYRGSGRTTLLKQLRKRDVVVTSYTLLQQDAEDLRSRRWATAILDEAQFIKNAETQRAKAAFGLDAAMRIAATGTPVENHLGDLWSIFRFLNPTLLGSAKRFGERFSTSATGTADPHRPRQRLRRLVSPFILRRTKAQVLDDLPPLTEIQHSVELSSEEAALYEAHRRRAVAELEGAENTPQQRLVVLAELTRLRRLCCDPSLVVPEARAPSAKLEAFVELAEELAGARHRALVFSQFVDFLGRARDRLDRLGLTYQYLDGSTSTKQRSARVEAFQSGEGQFFLISLKAGGFGLNLTGADYVVHLDPWWNPATEQQASDRAHRIGQTRPVTVYRLVTANTIEQRIVELHRSKRELADSLLEGTSAATKLTGNDLIQLLTETD